VKRNVKNGRIKYHLKWFFYSAFFCVWEKKDMRNIKNQVYKNWYWIFAFGILLVELIVFLSAGEQHTYIGIHDNLDIHIADYELLRNNNAFFSQSKILPFLGGINRDYMLSEFYLYSLLYVIFPNFAAYIAGYFLKIVIALFGGYLLGKDILKETFDRNKWIIVLISLTYGLLPLYPAFSFSFSSIPFLIYIIRKLQNGEGKRYYLYMFLYPMVSYFTFFGPFIMGYYLVYIVYMIIKTKKIPKSLIGGIILLGAGYVLIEYRLFRLIFFSGETTIRDAMVFADQDIMGIVKLIIDGFVNNMFHCEDLHRIVVLPLVLVYLIILNCKYIRGRKYKSMISDSFNRIFLLIVFNCIVYGLQECGPFRELFFNLIPPLRGWQFDRTIFFNPFLWYLEGGIIVYRIYNSERKKLSVAVMILMMISVMGSQSLYNDFYNTLYVNAYRITKHTESETLSYGEFYSKELFTKIKEDIGYNGEYSVAYGFHPAVLTYNGISTLDGCLSHYSQDYKDRFRNVIKPALDNSEVARKYYDDWGGRAYIFSDTTESVWLPCRNKIVNDNNLRIDSNAFGELNGKYIFSRIEITNSKELKMHLINVYSDDESPYTIWLYVAKDD
jgi:hypothetical protein